MSEKSFSVSLYALLIGFLTLFVLLVYVIFFAAVPHLSLRSNYHKSLLTKIVVDVGEVFFLLEEASFEKASTVSKTENLRKTLEQEIFDTHKKIAPNLIKSVQISFPSTRVWVDSIKTNVYGFSYLKNDLILKLPVVGVSNGAFQMSVMYDYKKVFNHVLKRSLKSGYKVYFTRNGSMMVHMQAEEIGDSAIQDIGKSIESPCYGSSTYFYRGQNLYGLCAVLPYVERSVIFLYRGGAPIPVGSQLAMGSFFLSILVLCLICYRDVSSRGETIFFRSESLPEVPQHLYKKKIPPLNDELHLLIESVIESPITKKRTISKESILTVGGSILQRLFWVNIDAPLLDQIQAQLKEYDNLHYMVLRKQDQQFVVTENLGFSPETQQKFRFSTRAKIVNLLEGGRKLVEIDNQKQDSQFLQENMGEQDAKNHPSLLCVPLTVDQTLHAIICIG